MNENIEILSQISKYCTPIHSIPGRLRVRISSNLKELKNDINFNQIINKIDGIKSVKFNKIIGSLTIEYDNSKFPQQLWHDLLEGKNLEQISQKIEAIKKEIYAN